MQIRIETGDPHTDALLQAALPLWENRLTMLSRDGVLLVCDDARWVSDTQRSTQAVEGAEATMVILLYRNKDWLDSPQHRKLRSTGIPYAALPLPLSLPQLAETIARMEAADHHLPLPLRLQPAERLVRCGNQSVHLTEKEYRLFEILYENEGQPVSRAVLQELVWPEGITGNVCEVNITHLRQKLTPLLGEGAIGSIRGKGYTLHLTRP